MIKMGDQHGCCGDETCSLGETFENCADDCSEVGAQGSLVWARDKPERGGRGGHQHGDDGDEGRRDDGDGGGPSPQPDDADNEHASEDHSDRTPPRGGMKGDRRGGDKGGQRRAPGMVRIIVSAFLALVGVGLLVSIRKSLRSILCDLKLFFWPFSSNNASVSYGGATHIKAVAVGGEGKTAMTV